MGKLDTEKIDKKKEYEVRLYCDLLNDEMKKSFSKTVKKNLIKKIILNNFLS